MKKLLKIILAHLGVVAFKHSSGIYIPEGESYRIAAGLCGKVAPLIIDGGAHRGDSVFAFSKHAPEARFHCFEPDPELVQHLKQEFAGNSRIHVVSAALGEAPTTATLNINASRLLISAVCVRPWNRSAWMWYRSIAIALSMRSAR